MADKRSIVVEVAVSYVAYVPLLLLYYKGLETCGLFPQPPFFSFTSVSMNVLCESLYSTLHQLPENAEISILRALELGFREQSQPSAK